MELFSSSNLGAVYGLSKNVAPPPVSLAISILLIMGVHGFGLLILRLVGLKDFTQYRWLRWNGIVIGAAALQFFLYPLALAGFFSRINAQAIAMGVIIFGAIQCRQSVKSCLLHNGRHSVNEAANNNLGEKVLEIIFYVIFVGLGLLSLGPITEADSLNYHIGVALDILNTGKFTFAPEWFHSRLAGGGEVLISLGLSLGAEQFSSLLQFSGLIGIIGIFKHGSCLVSKKWSLLCILSAISSPILIAWVASPKPFLLPIAMTTCAFTSVVFLLKENDDSYLEYKGRNVYGLICLLVMTAAVTKINFMVSGAMVGIFALMRMIKKREAVNAVLISLLMCILIIAPPIIWKHYHYGGSEILGYISPFPGNWPGMQEFEKALREHRESSIMFPFSLLIPSGIGQITTIIGIGIYLVLNGLIHIKKKEHKSAACVVMITTLLLYFLGQHSSRFFLEPFIWLLILTLVASEYKESIALKIYEHGIMLQGILVCAIIGYGVIALTVGSISQKHHEQVMNQFANGYSEMMWADSVLPADARLIVKLRSLALSPRFFVASDWQSYIRSNSDQKIVYENLTNNKYPNFIIFTTNHFERPDMKNCNGELFAGPFVSRVATRNPFNSGVIYDVWIVKLKHEDSSCEIQ